MYNDGSNNNNDDDDDDDDDDSGLAWAARASRTSMLVKS